MSEKRAWAALSLYRMAGAVASPMLAPYVALRAQRGKEDPARRRERHGHASAARPEAGPLIWVHAASVGETAAVTPLVRKIAAAGLTILMTTGTRTSAAIVEARLADCVIHQYAPLDLRAAVRRFLDHWRPDLVLVVESEIWPNTIAELAERRIPQVLVNARLSDRSFERWKGAPWLAEAILENLSGVVAQSEIDAERFRLLGARQVVVAGNLKADAEAPACDEALLAQFHQTLAGRPVWAALSTHEGEEEAAAACHIALKRRHPGLLTIVVPRHAERGDAIATALEGGGLNLARRSRDESVSAETDILLGDTTGEMGLYLRLSPIAFIGKSIAREGGQNPLEAAMLNTAILTGRYVQNFRDVYERLLRHGGAEIVRDGTSLITHVDALLSDETRRAAMIAGATEGVLEMRGALDRTLAALAPFVDPLKLAVRFDRRASTNGLATG